MLHICLRQMVLAILSVCDFPALRAEKIEHKIITNYHSAVGKIAALKAR